MPPVAAVEAGQEAELQELADPQVPNAVWSFKSWISTPSERSSAVSSKPDGVLSMVFFLSGTAR